ncbi:hypothetical protein NF699_08040 [Sphingomonadaceae bacterium OTU29LAMAA1]|nr:hypothetical protein NF699_08040 [Sphingomonadaceae bacterium OTU29LAMAA1]
MTLDGFLTVLALAAAIYAVLSPVQRQRVSLTWRPQLLLALPVLVLILGFELYDWSPPACPVVLGDICSVLILGGAETEVARKFAFLLAFAWLFGAVTIQAVVKPTLSSVPAFTEVATALIDEEQYGDALKLVEPQIGLLARASRRKCFRQRMRDWLEEFGPTPEHSFRRYLRRSGPRRHSGENWPDWAAVPVRWLARFVPAGRRGERAAGDLFQLLMSSPQLFDYIVSRRPYFALGLVREQVYGGADFLERFLGELMRRPGSALYQEVATNDHSDGLVGYHLPARNRILHFLFADAKVAEELSAWQGVGDYLKRLLSGDERPDYWVWLNGRPDWFERDQMRDPTYVGMFFFDIMVSSAAKQGVGYHMWLYYFTSFGEMLERGYDSSAAGIDRTAEFPSRAARLLYELVSHLTAWVGMLRHLPEGAVHRGVPDRPDYPATIPFAAAQALGRVLAVAVMSQKVDDGVIQTLHDVAIRTIKELHPDEGDRSALRAYLINALLSGGGRKSDPGYLTRLAKLLDRNDDLIEYEIPDYVAALNSRIEGTDR